MHRLTYEQLAKWSLASVSNARRLFNDASHLLDSGLTTSAFVLLGLSADELGKHVLITAFPTRDDSDAEWKKFWNRITRHEEKLGDSLLTAWMSDLFSFDDPPDPKEFHRLRLAATYVDLVDGSPVLPSDSVDAGKVRAAFARIGRFLEECEAIFGTDADRLAAQMHKSHAARDRTPVVRDQEWAFRQLAESMAKRFGLSEAEALRVANLIADGALAHRPDDQDDR